MKTSRWDNFLAAFGLCTIKRANAKLQSEQDHYMQCIVERELVRIREDAVKHGGKLLASIDPCAAWINNPQLSLFEIDPLTIMAYDNMGKRRGF